MRYLGGKHRQSRAIVAAIHDLHPYFDVYAEPFCGAMWSACAVASAFPGRKFLLSDANRYLMCMWISAVVDGWNPPARVTEADYALYNRTRPDDDPMTGYIGFAWSFGGKFFGGAARTGGKIKGSYGSTVSKINTLRRANVKLRCCDYAEAAIPNDASVYLDPPYANRTAQSGLCGVDRVGYLAYASQLSSRCIVLASDFENVQGWTTVHNWGDTVVRHLNGKAADGTVERLMLVQ